MISSPNISQNACGHDMCCHGIPRSSVFDYSGSVKCPGRCSCSCSCSCCLRKQTNVLVPAEHLSALRQLMFLGSGFGLFFTAVCGLTILYPHKLSRAWWKKICLSVQKQSRMNNTFERNSTCWITLLYLYLFHTTDISLPGITFLCHKIIILHFLCTFPKVSKMCHALFLSTMFRKKKMA